ncbi:MAG: tetratricopeptide repeat protein [Bdellovibrionales bacterium]|nr:tetratricopeptide repeat protein [Bdellovibrionales bacterium]
MSSNRRWIIRDAKGRIEGPFTTEKVLYKIGRSEFSGEEYIAHFPDGKWIPISQDPQFYDRLLEVLSSKQDVESTEETQILEFTRQDEPGSMNVPREDLTPGGSIKVEPTRASSSPRKKKKSRRKPEDIELVDVRPQVFRQILRRARLPMFVALAGLLVTAILWSGGGSQSEQRIRLLAPQKNIAQVAPETLTTRVRSGLAGFLRDSLDGYSRAQNDFVYVIERNTKDAKTMGWLCMTYLQLWPYAYQDSGDSKVITQLMQMTSLAAPGSIDAATCRAVDLIVRARTSEAKNLVESVLENIGNNANPPVMFYFMKGDLLATSGDYASAVGYLRSTQQLWPQWQLPYIVEAYALSKMEKYPEAARLYRQVLKANPNHTIARIELGLLEYKYFNHPDLGEKYLLQALEFQDAPRTTLSRGQFGLAQISLARGNQQKALEYAQKAFSLNSSNDSAKNLIVQLGGVQKLRTIKVKGQQLMFEGDQFFREGDCHAAQAHYKAAFEEDQKNAMAAMKAAQCLWKLSFSTEAIDWLNRAIKSDPKLIEAYVILADYHAQRYNFMAAGRVLESARRMNPKSSEVYRGFAMVELRRGNPKGAIAFGKQATQIYENDVEMLIIMAEASMALRDPKMAFNYAKKAMEIDVNHRKAQIVYAQALAGIQGVDAGVDYLLRMVTNYPLVSEYRLALGKMLLADERYQNAEEVFRYLTRIEEKPKEAYVELSKVLKSQGEMNEALDLLLKAAVLDPADAEPLYLAGGIYLDLKKPQEAAVQFKRVLMINKLYPLVNYQLGRAAMQLNDPQAALGFAELEKRANPNLSDAYLLAADAQTMLGQFSLCVQEYTKAIKLRSQPAGIYVKVASCNRRAGHLDAAMNMLNVAASRESGYADIYKEQGAIYEQKGDPNHAITAYEHYLALDPDAPDKEQIEQRISTLQRGGRN